MIQLDLEDPNQLSQLSPWELDFRQIESGPLRTRVRVRSGRFTTVLQIAMSKAVHQMGAAPPDQLTFGVPGKSNIKNWQGAAASALPLVVFGSGAAFEGHSRSDFVGTTFSLNKDALFAFADGIGMEIPQHVLAPGLQHAARTPASHVQLGATANALLSPRDSAFGETEEEDFALLLVKTLTEAPVYDDKSTPRKRDRAFARAVDCMLAHADENLPISQVCRHAGASQPTLERAFTERLGIGPKAYYTCLRLQRARAGLLSKSPETPIADIANRWGFWHMGQFARDYRRLFGHAPSSDCRR